MALYDDYLTQLGRSPTTQQRLEKDLGDAKIDAGLTTARLGKSSEASNARSAFAAGKASGQKKTFKGRSSGAYGAIGRLDGANLTAAATAQKNVSGLDQLSDQSTMRRNAELTAANASSAASLASIRNNLQAPIKLW